MALKGNFDQAAFEKKVQQALENRKMEVLETLIFLGDQCVIEARSAGSYTDRTGNLRNSVGFVILENGNILHENFEETAKGTESSEDDPIKTGRNLAVQVGSNYQGMVLVVVAGMKYAMHVEARGYNVLTSAEYLANKELPKLLEALR